MKNSTKPLTDQEIQAYLDGDPAVNRSRFEDRLKSCKNSCENFNAYLQLYKGLKDDKGFILSANFGDAVIDRIEIPGDTKFDFLEIAMFILVMITGIASIFYFTNLGGIMLELFQNLNLTAPEYLNSIPMVSHGNWHLVVFAALALSFFGFLDKMILRIKHRL